MSVAYNIYCGANADPIEGPEWDCDYAGPVTVEADGTYVCPDCGNVGEI